MATTAERIPEHFPRLFLVAHGPAARLALWEIVDAVKGADPLAPVTVAVPSPYVGLSLRRGFRRAGFANVRFMALARVAELLGAPRLAAAGLRPLTGALRAHAVRAALESRPGPLARFLHHPATNRALERTIADLRRAGPAARDSVARQSDRAAGIVTLAGAYEALTRAFFDDDDLFRAAAEAITRGSSALSDVGTVIVYLPLRLSPAEERFVGALAAAGRAAAVIGVTGDVAADRGALEIASRLDDVLGAPDVRTAATTPRADRILHATDPDDEVRAVVRRIAALATTMSLDRVALLYRLEVPYGRLVRSALDSAGIAWNGPSGRRLADSVAGRTLLGLLDLAVGDLGREQLTGWLATGPVLDPADGRQVAAHRVDNLSRRAGVIAGIDQWTQRLARLADDRDRELAELRAGGEAPESRLRGLEADSVDARRAAAFAKALADRLAPPDESTWTAFAAWAVCLIDDYLGTESRRSSWPDDEADAARRVVVAIEGLAELAQVDPTVDATCFRRAVERELEAPAARRGRFGEGVFAGPLGSAYAGDFDSIFVVGVSEGSFPPRGQEDPLLPDRERAVAGDELPLQAHRRAEERRDFLAALASSREVTLSFPRADPRAGRAQLPARWLLESASALAGEPVGAAALLELGAEHWLVPVQSFESGLVESSLPGSEPFSACELDVGWLRRWQQAGGSLRRHPLVAAEPTLAAGLAASAARTSKWLTAFDGLVGPLPDLTPSSERPISPTALQYWATCPRRYLFEQVLKVREVERPEETETIAPTERGTLVHDILERFFDNNRPARPSARWGPADRASLLDLTRALCADVEARGLTGRPLLWKVERRRIERIVDSTLDVDEVMRGALGVVPVAFEKSFGMDGLDPATIDLGDGRRLAFKGRIDRIDASPDGSVVVVFDYKTGRGVAPSILAKDPVDAGRRLQLPIYATAVAGIYPDAEVHAYFWCVEAPGSRVRSGYAVDEPRLARFGTVLRSILDGISAGVFPAAGRPGREGAELDGCSFCPYRAACPPGRARAWERKQSDPAAAPYLALALPQPDELDRSGGET